MAGRQYQERAHFSPTTTTPQFSVSSPPGLSLNMQNAASNAFAHSANLIPGLAFGSPPVPGLTSYITNHQALSASPDLQRAQVSAKNGSGPKVPAIPVSNNHDDQLSEGEFEEEFEDLYEPRDVAAAPARPDNMLIDENNSSWFETAQPSTGAASVADEDWEPTLTQQGHAAQHTTPPQMNVPASTAGSGQVPPSDPVPDLAKTVADAKKKAQEAILALWPLKVRYQNYIDEGFDESVVQALFKELGLDTTGPQLANRGLRGAQGVTAKDQGTSQEQARVSTTTAPLLAIATPQIPLSVDQAPATTGHTAKSAAEERKDKIARKLAAKSQKPAAMPNKNLSAAPSSGPTAPDKIKARKEVNALLQQKLAALKKAQEQAAANKLAEQANSIPAGTVVTNLAQSQSFATPSVPTVLEAERGRQASEPIQDTHQKASRPPLTTIVSSSSGPSRLPKRPVASDFDSYTTPSYDSPKRSRTQDTLIIDVSDDDDVEMEIGSPVDESFDSSAQRDVDDQTAELTEHEAQQRFSGPATPESNGKLHLLRGKIEEMRRRIAEAEAKKSSKTPIDSGSPRPQSPARLPAPAASFSNRLPKVSELREQAAQQGFARPDRVVSVELLLVESDLKTKQDKLKEVVAEAARLELEIKNALAQRHKLTTEMEQMGSVGQDQTESPQVEAGTNIELAMIAQAESSSSSDESDKSSDPDDQGQESSSVEPSAVPEELQHLPAGAELLLGGTESRTSAESRKSPSAENSEGDEGAPEDEDGDVSMSEDDSDSSDSDISMKSTAAEEMPDDENPSASPSAEVSSDTDMNAASASLNEPEENLPERSDALNTASASSEDSTNDVVDRVATNPTVRTGDTVLTSLQTSSQTAASEEDISSYRSPLEYFRAYRFHPKYSDEVAGGLKSLTYSSNINVEQMVCPSELDGQDCADPTCDYQHFQKMVLSALTCYDDILDGDIITQIGSADMFSGNTKVHFIAGLRKILHDLKVNKVKDFDRITKAIIDYRAEFLEDRSKVLALDGVTI